MTQKQLEQIVELVKSGHVIQVLSPYVDSFAKVYQEDGDGDWMYETQVYGPSKLIHEKIHDIRVYKPVTLDY